MNWCVEQIYLSIYISIHLSIYVCKWFKFPFKIELRCRTNLNIFIFGHSFATICVRNNMHSNSIDKQYLYTKHFIDVYEMLRLLASRSRSQVFSPTPALALAPTIILPAPALSKRSSSRLLIRPFNVQHLMEPKGMTFEHDFCYFILLFFSLLKKEGREKEYKETKIVIKSHTFLFHPTFHRKYIS